MNVIVLQVFVSLMLVAGAVALFVYTVRSRTLEHSERLSLAPLDDEQSRTHDPSSDRSSDRTGQR